MEQRRSGNEQQALDLFFTIFWLVVALLLGCLLFSRFLTRLLFEHVLNPLLDGRFDGDDGAVVFLSAIIWALVASLVLFPVALGQNAFGPNPDNLLGLWAGTALLGAVWGTVVGVWVLGVWWAEVEQRQPAGYDVIQLLDTPIDIRQPVIHSTREYKDGHRTNYSNGHEEPELEELILGNDPWV